MANPLLARSAGGGLLGATRAKGPSVISVTYGVSYGCQKAFKTNALTLWIVPKGANFGSERCEFWFRKVRASVPESTNGFGS